MEAQGFELYLDQSVRSSATPWPQFLAQAMGHVQAVIVLIGPQGLDHWQKRVIGFALDRQAQAHRDGHTFPVIPVLLPEADPASAFMFHDAWIDLREIVADSKSLQSLFQAIHEPISRPIAVIVDMCPYRGLQSFREEDAAFFYGRERFVGHLAELVAEQNLVTVVGSAGSGKSSVVGAGLLPLLRRQRPPATVWDAISFTPGDQPFHRLTAALIPWLRRNSALDAETLEPHVLANQLVNAEIGLSETIDPWFDRGRSDQRLLLVIDQFEELFILTPEPERQRFVEMLLRALDSSVSLLLTLRADYMEHFVTLGHGLERSDIRVVKELSRSVEKIGGFLEQSVVELPAMTRRGLGQALLKPARQVTLGFEPGLVSTILDDVAGRADQIPLLQATATALWQQHRGGLLSRAAYEQAGGVTGAVAYQADQCLHALSPKQQRLARFIFTRLVRLSGREDVRLPPGSMAGRSVTVNELLAELPAVKEWDVMAVIQKLSEVRLLTVEPDDGTGSTRLEAPVGLLLQHWPQLRAWLDEERSLQTWRQHVEPAMLKWERSGKSNRFLLRRGTLSEAEAWLANWPDHLAFNERSFIQTSLGHRERGRQLRWFVTAAATVIAVLLVAILAIQQVTAKITAEQRRHAVMTAQAHSEIEQQRAERAQATAEAVRRETERRREIELARHLSIDAQMILEDEPVRGLLLAIEALRRRPSFESEQILRRGLAFMPRIVTQLGVADEVFEVAFNPSTSKNGLGQQWLAVANTNGSVRVWPTSAVSDGTAAYGQGELELQHEGGINDIALSPDGRWLATAGVDGTTRIWQIVADSSRLPFYHTLGQNMVGAQELGYLTQESPVTRVIFSPDGRWLATTGLDRTVRLWWLGAGISNELFVSSAVKPRVTLEATRLRHEAKVTAVSFSSRGQWLATASADGLVRIWSLPSPDQVTVEPGIGSEVMQLKHKAEVTSLSFSRHGLRLATGSRDRMARVWDLSTGQELVQLVHPTAVRQVTFSPNGLWLATVSSDHAARLWSLAADSNGDMIGHRSAVMRHRDDIHALVFSADSRRLATASADGTATVWKTVTGQEMTRMVHDDGVKSIAFSPDGRWLATASDDHTVRIWERDAGQEAHEIEQKDWIMGVAFSPDGQWLAVRNRWLVRVLSLRAEQGTQFPFDQAVVSEIHKRWINTVAFSPDGRWFATGSRDGMARIWEIATGRQVAELAHESGVSGLRFSPDSQQLAVRSGRSVQVWSLSSRRGGHVELSRASALLEHGNWVSALAFNPNGRLLATASSDHTARVWDMATGQEVTRMPHEGVVFDIAFSPDGQWLATASADRTARIWLAASVREVARLDHESGVEAVEFSPDGRWLATRSSNLAHVWELGTATAGQLLTNVAGDVSPGREIARLVHKERVQTLTFSPDGRWLATATGEPPGSGTARVWLLNPDSRGNLSSRAMMRVKHDFWVGDVAFSPDNRWLVTGGGDRQLRIWMLQHDDLIEAACTRLTRNLSRAEWQQYLGERPYRRTCPKLPVPMN